MFAVRHAAAVLALGLAAAAPAAAHAQARDFAFCDALTLVLSASNEAEPFSSLLRDQSARQGYTTLALPGFEQCYVGRFGAEPPGIATYSCRNRKAPDDLSAQGLMDKVGVCLEKTPEVDEAGLSWIVAPPTRIRAEEAVMGENRMVLFKIEVTPKS